MARLQQDQDLFDGLSDGVMTRTIEGSINFWNRGAEKLYGWRKEEAIGQVSHSLLQTQFPKPLQEIESELVRNGWWEGKLVHTTRDGARVVVKSRWTLDLKGQSGTIVEINARFADREPDPEGRTDSNSLEIERQEPLPAKELPKLDDRLAKIANVILSGGGIFCLLLLFGVFYYYGWSGQRSFASPAGQFIYFAIPGLLAIALFACLRLPASQRINIALCCASVALTIYTVEATVTLWFGLPSVRTSQNSRTRMEAAQALGVKYDRRTKAEVIEDFRKQGIDAGPALYPEELLKEQQDGTMKSAITMNGVEVLPLASLANKMAVVCNEGGEYLTYRTDQYGFNNPQQVWHMPVDIVAVGDSFTQGWCVDPESNFVSRIRQRHPGTLNLGIEGNGPLAMLAALKEYAEVVRPKVVLWFYFEGNDLSDLRRERQNSILARYLANNEFSQALFNRQAEIDRALAEYLENVSKMSAWSIELKEISKRIRDTDWMANRLKAIVKLSKLRQRLGFVYGKTETFPQDAAVVPQREDVPQIELLFDVLLQAKKLVGEWGGSLYFIYLPARDRYGPWESGPGRARYAVLQTASKAGLPVIDLHPIFMAQKDPLSLFALRLAVHYNEEGNRLVAQEVLRSIRAGKAQLLRPIEKP